MTYSMDHTEKKKCARTIGNIIMLMLHAVDSSSDRKIVVGSLN